MKTIFKFFRYASKEKLIDLFDSSDIDEICDKYSSSEIIAKIHNYSYYPAEYTLFWLDGTKEIIKGNLLDFDNALRCAGRNRWGLAFHLDGNALEKYEWDNTSKLWVKQEHTNE